LCDYKVWIDTERGAEAKQYLCNMVELNMIEDELCACRMAECKHTDYFTMQREMAREEYKEKREEEKTQKQEKTRCAKEAYARGGERALMEDKWPHLTQD
jgi:lysozyme family protein